MREETFVWYIFYSIDTFIIFLLIRIYLFIDTYVVCETSVYKKRTQEDRF